MLSLYVAGFVGAMTTAWLLKSSILKSSETPFILELPQYRMPTLRALSAMRLVDRASVFLRQAGTIILCVTLALWVLAHLPVVHCRHGAYTAPELADSVIGTPRPLHRAGHRAPRLQLEDRHRPALESLAREVMLSTMGTLYGADPATQA